MDCPTCSKECPSHATVCTHCGATLPKRQAISLSPVAEPPKTPLSAGSSDVTIGNNKPAPPPEATGGSDKSEASDSTIGNDGPSKSLEGWWDDGPTDPSKMAAKKPVAPPQSNGSAFVLPSRATLSNDEATPGSSESAAHWSSLLAKTTKEPQNKSSGLDDLLDDSWGDPPQTDKTVSVDSLSDKPDTPSKAKVSPWAPRKSDESGSKSYGRSAEVQDAPLHDSWSTGESSQEKDAGDKSGWAAALQAARAPDLGDKPSDRKRVQESKASRPSAVENTRQEEPTPDEKPEPPPLPALKPKKKNNGRKIVLRLAVSILVIVGMGALGTVGYKAFKNMPAPPIESSTPAPKSTPKDDATIWLASAQESLAAKDFKLAVPQLEKAVSFMKKGEGEPGQLKETQILLAKTYGKAGQYNSSATLWTKLAKSHPDLRKKGKAAAAAALRENRLIANQKIKAGEKALKSKKFDDAIKSANAALEIYTSSQGQPAQIARAHGILGDAYRDKRNTRIAYGHFSEASKLDPEGRYRSEMNKLRIPSKPRPRPKSPRRLKPSFVTKSSVPRGNSRR